MKQSLLSLPLSAKRVIINFHKYPFVLNVNRYYQSAIGFIALQIAQFCVDKSSAYYTNFHQISFFLNRALINFKLRDINFNTCRKQKILHLINFSVRANKNL